MTATATNIATGPADAGKAAKSFLSAGFLLLVVLLMSAPFIAVVLNAVAAKWDGTILPTELTFDHIANLFSQPRFYQSLGRSVMVAGLSLALATVLTVPAILVAHVYWPALDRWLARLVVLPYAIPGVVLVVGYLRVFSVPPMQINGTMWILVLAYVPLCFPMFYVCLKNALQGLPVQDYLDAGRLVGARDEAILARVVVPMIFPAIVLALVLNFSSLMGEFVYANLLVGGRFETFQIYMYAQSAGSGRLTSAIILVYFLFLVLTTALSLTLSRKRIKA